MREISQLRAAVLFLDGDSQHTQLAHLAPQIHRKLIGPIDLGGARRNLRLRKIAHRFAQRVDVIAEMKVESGQLHQAQR